MSGEAGNRPVLFEWFASTYLVNFAVSNTGGEREYGEMIHRKMTGSYITKIFLIFIILNRIS